MADVGAITGVISAFKAIGETLKVLLDARDAASVHGQITKLQEQIMAAQTSALAAQADQFALVERVRDLEKEKAQFETWDAEKQKYQLAKISPYSESLLMSRK